MLPLFAPVKQDGTSQARKGLILHLPKSSSFVLPPRYPLRIHLMPQRQKSFDVMLGNHAFEDIRTYMIFSGKNHDNCWQSSVWQMAKSWNMQIMNERSISGSAITDLLIGCLSLLGFPKPWHGSQKTQRPKLKHSYSSRIFWLQSVATLETGMNPIVFSPRFVVIRQGHFSIRKQTWIEESWLSQFLLA